jgi:dTDP-4-amino-4,6-dideoxygalactose transaminase
LVELIPFNLPYIPEISKVYAQDVLNSKHQQGDGPYTEKTSNALSKLVGGGKVLLTPSCTHALEMASMLAEIGPGDEVILPAFTFTSAATAVTKFGASPVFVDINQETKCIDPSQVLRAITPRTRAISWVNYAGITPDIRELKQIADDHGLLLIEDNAHGLGGSHSGMPLGSFGDFAAQSFHSTKNIQCGEGGALVINNPKYYDRAEIIREKGTNRRKFIEGQVSKYNWVDNGSSYLLAEILAAILLGQIENFDLIQAKRISIWNKYAELLEKNESTSNFKIQKLTKQNKNVAHMFYISFGDRKTRERFRNTLLEKGIQTTSHYEPLNTSPAGLRYNSKIRTHHSIEFSENILRLPLHLELDESQIVYIVENINSIHAKK